MPFTNIEIVGIDEEASSRASGPHCVIFEIVLKLSASAPSDWSNYFNQSWLQHIYMMKRRAHSSGPRVTIFCPPDEFENHHLPQLNAVIAETNNAYQSHLAKMQGEEEKSQQAEANDKEIIRNLCTRIAKLTS
jgi:hypothetical protein